MAYLTESELNKLGFLHLGKNVKISSNASIYNHDQISIGDFSRIDDFCVISGKVDIGKYVHITPMCLIAGGSVGVELNDYSTLAYGVKIFSQSDDYSGETMTNSLIPKKYKNEKFAKVRVGNFVILGAGVTVLPGVDIADGCSVGAMSLLLKSTEPWYIYAGLPARKIKKRSENILLLAAKFENE